MGAEAAHGIALQHTKLAFSRIEQVTAAQSSTEQHRAAQSSIEQHRAAQSNTEQNRTAQSTDCQERHGHTLHLRTAQRKRKRALHRFMYHRSGQLTD